MCTRVCFEWAHLRATIFLARVFLSVVAKDIGERSYCGDILLSPASSCDSRATFHSGDVMVQKRHIVFFSFKVATYRSLIFARLLAYHIDCWIDGLILKQKMNAMFWRSYKYDTNWYIQLMICFSNLWIYRYKYIYKCLDSR